MTTTVTNMTATARPRLALVLGSGGVRSAAALGITEVLAREGVSPDLIVGCSSGALYGAAIAMGMSHATALTLWSSELTEQRRWRAYAELLAPRLFGFGAHFSLRDAGRISARIRDGFGGWRLESLPTRAACRDDRCGDRRMHRPLAGLARRCAVREHRAAVRVPERRDRRPTPRGRRALQSAAHLGRERRARDDRTRFSWRNAAPDRSARPAPRAGQHHDDQQPAGVAPAGCTGRRPARPEHRAGSRCAHRLVASVGDSANLRSRPTRSASCSLSEILAMLDETSARAA